MHDPYTTLGVSRSASADEIKRAYRKLAHQHHPDKKGGNEAKFKEINEAYQILGDSAKKEQYDRFGHAGAGFGGGGAPFGGQYQDFNFDFGGGGFETLFDMFGGMGGARQKPQKGEDLHLEVTVSRAHLGQKKTYEYEAMDACGDCSGSGAQGGKLVRCSACGGQGRVRRAVRTPLGTFAQAVACGDCGGDGELAEKKCRACNGGGRVKRKRSLELHLPASLEDRYLVGFPQGGNAGPKGVPAGDLTVSIRVS